jgi:hypothetical protein
MKKSLSLTALIALSAALAAPLAAQAAEKLTVQSPAVYEKGAVINDKIKQECALDERVPDYVQNAARGSFDVSTAKSPSGAGKTLSLAISDVSNSGGGSWSGPKWLVISGTLKDNGKVIGTFRARRTATGAGWGGSTCGMLNRCAKTLGKDVLKWLEQPSMNAKLGELH